MTASGEMAFTFVACDDLKRICESIATSVDRWGGTVAENQAAADAFARHFERHCEFIAANPELGVARPELQREIRSSAFQRHVIFYRLRGGKLEVLRILPAAKDVAAIA